MRKRMIGSLAALLVGGSVSLAQVPLASVIPPPLPANEPPIALANAPSPATSPGPIDGWFSGGGCDSRCQLWGSAEYLFWRFKDAPLPQPLVTTSAPADAGILGKPSTQVLFGGGDYSSGWEGGVRFTLGAWLDNEMTIGVEASAFYFGPRTPTDFAMKTTNPSQILAIPFNNVTPGGGTGNISTGNANPASGPDAFRIAGGHGGTQTGSIAVNSSSSLWGAEFNGVLNICRSRCFQVDLIGGARYLDLVESLDINTSTQNIGTGIGSGPLEAATFGDHFGTRNQFYGGQLGLKAEWSNGIFFANILGKVALGATHETVNNNGFFSDSNPNVLAGFGTGKTGGLLTQPSSTGTFEHTHFGVVPETALQVGVNLRPNIRLFAGYDFLYMNSMVRPGNQIDHNVNLTQAGSAPSGLVPTLVGPASPGVPFQQSSFWAQGVNFGILFRY